MCIMIEFVMKEVYENCRFCIKLYLDVEEGREERIVWSRVRSSYLPLLKATDVLMWMSSVFIFILYQT